MEDSNNYILLVMFGTFGMISLVGVVIFLGLTFQKRVLQERYEKFQMEAQHKETLIKSTIASQEKERLRIARALHDEVGVLLSTIRMAINFKLAKFEDLEGIAAIKNDSLELIDISMETVRRISHEMSAKVLEQQGLSEAIRQTSRQINKSGGLRIQMNEVGAPKRFDPNKELILYRISQELLNNTIKHAEATQMDIKLNWLKTHLELTVEDNGKGFSVTEEKEMGGGIGISNMETQANAIDASLIIDSTPGKGAKTTLAVPFEGSLEE